MALSRRNDVIEREVKMTELEEYEEENKLLRKKLAILEMKYSINTEKMYEFLNDKKNLEIELKQAMMKKGLLVINVLQ